MATSSPNEPASDRSNPIDEAVRAWRPEILRIAKREIGAAHRYLDAEEIVQDVLLEFYLKQVFEPRAITDFSLAYFSKSIKSHIINEIAYHQRQCRDVRREQHFCSEQQQCAESSGQEAPDTALRVEDVWAAILAKAADEIDRAILIGLREGQSPDDLAKHQQVNVGTVYRRIERLRRSCEKLP